METTIDTALLTPNALGVESNGSKIEEDIQKMIEKTVKEQAFAKESMTVQIESVTYHNFNTASLVIHGKMVKSNQSRYKLQLSDCLFLFIEDDSLIKGVLSQVSRKMCQLTVNIDDCIIFPHNCLQVVNDFEGSRLKAFAYLLPSLMKLYICIVSRHAYSKHSSILISASSLTESMLLSKSLSLIGYTPYYTTMDSSKESPQWTNSSECLSFSPEEDDTFNYVIDISGKMLLNKKRLFSLLKPGGMFYSVNYSDEDYADVQLIPADLVLMQKRGVGIGAISIAQSIQSFVDYGKVINYCNELLTKHLDETLVRCIGENVKVNVIDIANCVLNGNSSNATFNKGINVIL